MASSRIPAAISAATAALTQQLRRLGASGDWSFERFTLDEGLREG